MNTINENIDKQLFVVKPHQLSLKVLDEDISIKRKRKNYPQPNIYTIPNFLSEEEAGKIIESAEDIGFQAAGLAIAQDVFRVKEKTRNNLRMMFEDAELADALWLRLLPFVDKKYDNRLAHGLNWRFRVYKYEEGAIFAPHVDEQMQLPSEQDLLTLFTFMVYLNEAMEGGETTFFERRTAGKMPINRVIYPKTGMALAFDHLLFHEGSIVKKGVKYVLRSDIVYRKK